MDNWKAKRQGFSKQQQSLSGVNGLEDLELVFLRFSLASSKKKTHKQDTLRDYNEAAVLEERNNFYVS